MFTCSRTWSLDEASAHGAAMACTVNVHEARIHLPKLLADVARGEEIAIARGGKPVARPVPCGRAGHRGNLAGPKGSPSASPPCRPSLPIPSTGCSLPRPRLVTCRSLRPTGKSLPIPSRSSGGRDTGAAHSVHLETRLRECSSLLLPHLANGSLLPLPIPDPPDPEPVGHPAVPARAGEPADGTHGRKDLDELVTREAPAILVVHRNAIAG